MQSENAYTVGINERQRSLLQSAMLRLITTAEGVDPHTMSELTELHEMLRDLPDEEHDDPGATHMFYL